MKHIIYIGSLIIFLIVNVAQADILVGIKEAKPFAYKSVDSTSTIVEWKGISVDLINQLSKETGIKYKFVPYDNITALLNAAAVKDVDMSIAAISMTPDREEKLDFSHSYFTTSLGILTHTKASWWETVLWIGKKLLIILTIFVIFLYIVGFIMDKIDGDDNIKGAHAGAWWALVTFTTTGYGDLVPKTGKGKIVASIWMVSSLFLISIFTGYVASSLTVKNLSNSPTTLSDLSRVTVAVVAGSTAEYHLNVVGIKHKSVTTLNDALNLFNAGKVKAIVHDDAMLSYAARTSNNITVWPIENTEEAYAIALPQDSALTEKVNLGILKILASPEWKAIRSKYNVH